MIQVEKSEWDEVASPIHLCTLQISVEDAESQTGISFQEFNEVGLGTCYAAYLKHNSSMCYLMGFIDKKNKKLGISVYMRSFEPNPETLLNELCNFFKIDALQLIDVSDSLSSPKWAVYRLDDNNNKIEMFVFHCKDVAEYIRASYEAKKHKQMYLIEEKKTTRD